MYLLQYIYIDICISLYSYIFTMYYYWKVWKPKRWFCTIFLWLWWFIELCNLLVVQQYSSSMCLFLCRVSSYESFCRWYKHVRGRCTVYYCACMLMYVARRLDTSTSMVRSLQSLTIALHIDVEKVVGMKGSYMDTAL